MPTAVTKDEDENTMAPSVEWSFFVCFAAPRCFFWFGKKKYGSLWWKGWLEWRVRWLFKFPFLYKTIIMQETPGTWTNGYPSKREALSNIHFFQRALHPLNFRKGTIISNSKNGKDIYNILFRSLRTQCLPDLLATVLTPGPFSVGCCLFSPFQKKGIYFGVAMSFATKNKHKKNNIDMSNLPVVLFGRGEQWSSKNPKVTFYFPVLLYDGLFVFHGLQRIPKKQSRGKGFSMDSIWIRHPRKVIQELSQAFGEYCSPIAKCKIRSYPILEGFSDTPIAPNCFKWSGSV